MDGMETFLKALEKAPEMLALLGLVWMFLRAQADSRKEFLTTMHTLNAENIEARNLTRHVIEENTTSNTNLTLAVRSLEQRIQRQ